MCGIAAVVGSKDAKRFLLSALKRMEYRGYDSAGIALSDEGDIKISKVAGKVGMLIDEAQSMTNTAEIGIGHTRWATHGEPNQTNAHPHQAGSVSIVHNGIIENYAELKKDLSTDYEFTSDTDTEVLAALIDSHFSESNNLHSAVSEALSMVRGTFGLIAMADDIEDTLVVARKGSPVVLGRKDDTIYIASDATALLGLTKEVIYLEDNDIAICKSGFIEVFDLKNKKISRDTEELNLEEASIQKEGFDHFLLKEIMEQPKSSKETLRGHLRKEDGTSHLGGVFLSDEEIRNLNRMQVIGCGTAFYAGLLGKYLLEKFSDLPVDVEVASEFRYRQPVLSDNTVGVVISQSGETADTLAALRELTGKGHYVHGLVNSVGSTIAREVNGGMYLHVGPEISVASTKAFTSQVIGILLFGLYLARKRSTPLAVGEEVVDALDKLPSEIDKVIEEVIEPIKSLAKKLKDFDHAMYLGRDTLYPVALEGALKIKEVSYIHAEGFAAGEMKHGPIALLDEKFFTVFLLQKGPMFEKSRTNLEENQARGGTTIVITDHMGFATDNPDAIFVPTTSKWTMPLLFNIPLQLLAYYVAVENGSDVDQPRNLAKSVTVE